MRSVRWRKLLRDLFGAKTRTALVVLSIAVGVFAVGMIASSRVMLRRDMSAAYAATNPGSAVLVTDAFDDELVRTIRRVPGVREAEGRRSITVRLTVAPGVQRDLELLAYRDYRNIQIDKLRPVQGAWPPPARQLLIEHASLGYTHAHIGDTVQIELANGRQRQLRIAGLVHDLSRPSAEIAGSAFGYITLDTLEWLGEPRSFNDVHLTVTAGAQDRASVELIAQKVRAKVEQSGRMVYRTVVPKPGKHWADDVVQPLLLLLAALGGLALLLSGFLVITTISALLAQQVRQIGVMKAIGGRRDQIALLYLGMVLIFSLLALGIAVPLGAAGAWAAVRFISGLLNFDSTSAGIPLQALGLEVMAGLLVPLLAALYPVLAGTRLTVREAISAHGLSTDSAGTGLVDRLLHYLPRVVPGLPRPVLLSLRNSFRRRGRLVLTLATLTLAGATFIAVFSVRASLLATLDVAARSSRADLYVGLQRPYRLDQIEYSARAVDGVVAAEGWGMANLPRVRPNKTESEDIAVVGLPAADPLFQPAMVRGRWLLPTDGNAVVVTTDLLKDEPDLAVGDDLVLKIKQRETSWRVVGVAQVALAGRKAYVNYAYYAQVMGEVGRAVYAPIVAERHDTAFQSEIVQALEAQLKRDGIHVSRTDTAAAERGKIELRFNILVVFLWVMAILLGAVGALGLAGTMSMNVLERTRELAVMRAIGASNRGVLQIVLVEGVFIGVLSACLGTFLAFPMSLILGREVGQVFLNGPLSYTFSLSGTLLWLGLVVVLSALASGLPAWRAAQITVRDALAYE